MSELIRMARRTRVRPGKAEEYARVHAQLPEAVFDSLREAGIVSWRIWAVEDDLFHFIEAMPKWLTSRAAEAAKSPVDPEWAALIDTLVSDAPGDNEGLTAIWGMDRLHQWAGQG